MGCEGQQKIALACHFTEELMAESNNTMVFHDDISPFFTQYVLCSKCFVAMNMHLEFRIFMASGDSLAR